VRDPRARPELFLPDGFDDRLAPLRDRLRDR
jgi:hypothetical protein